MIDLAYAMGPTPQAGGGPGAMLIQIAPIVLVLGIFFFLVIRPQQRDRKRREEMLAALKKGDRVVTSGGLIGTDRGSHRAAGDPEDRRLVRVECLRSAVTGLDSDGKADAESA